MGCWDDSRRETLPSVLPRNKIDDPALLLPGAGIALTSVAVDGDEQRRMAPGQARNLGEEVIPRLAGRPQVRMTVLKKLTYNPLVIRIVRALGLRSALRKAYYAWARPRNGIMPVKLGEFDCRFHVRTPEQLRMVGKAATGHWRIEVIQFLDKNLRSGDVVYDIGSNIGICSVFAARKTGAGGQVFAFEPAAETYAHLNDNLQLNGLTNARAFRVALADYNGEAGLFTGDDLLFSSLVTSRNGQEKSQSVRVVRGDRFREEQKLPNPDVVMIDVEGFEKGVMTGLRLTLSDTKCRAVIAEIHPTLLPPGVTDDEILEFLSSCGFAKIDTLRWQGIPEFYAIAEREGPDCNTNRDRSVQGSSQGGAALA